MTLFKKLHSHKGKLVRIKSSLYWCNGRGWDNSSDLVCLVLHVAKSFSNRNLSAVSSSYPDGGPGVIVKLLIEGQPHLIKIHESDVEFINDPV